MRYQKSIRNGLAGLPRRTLVRDAVCSVVASLLGCAGGYVSGEATLASAQSCSSLESHLPGTRTAERLLKLRMLPRVGRTASDVQCCLDIVPFADL